MESGVRDLIKKSWEAKRNKAIERFVAAWEKYGGSHTGDDPEPVNAALDAVTVAHLATALVWETSVKGWDETEGKAMERLVSAWEKYDGTDENPEAEDELNIALDAIAIAHAAATFEWATGPLKL